MQGYIYIGLTIFFTVYGQLILKWRVGKYGPIPSDTLEKLKYLFTVVIDPFIISGFVAAFLASLAWIGAMTKFELSFSYPFMSLNFVLVFVLSYWLFDETLNWYKVIGLLLIIAGTIVTSKA
ncbi:EamA family transporter [Vibrio brasiliensis]|uniref:EamA family transporter n=1 Tax=Vibrio brasiliensis TaxID=170652 RepID=UPI001EFDDA5F|nr:EamA family transporter [Vibrio brasiliensis]MCG9650474.1 EamA family transporter [Vibrio brasiliensis]MCG9783381.1 EamA family transporter [Vibrio brasiliensis]